MRCSMQKYQKGQMVKGVVTGITDYGIFVSLFHHYSGLVHISEFSYRFVNNINDFVKLGDTIFVRILDVNHETKRLRLNVKDIYPQLQFRKVYSKIKETSHGFSTLSHHLPIWIEESLKKLEKDRISIDKLGVK